MMRLATVEQSQEIDSLSQKAYGLTSEVLMEAAGALASREIDQAFLPELTRGSIAVVCGPGHNGGDGLVLARHLHSAGHRDLTVFYLGHKSAPSVAAPSSNSKLLTLQLQRAQSQGLRILFLQEQPKKLEQLRSAELIVDALFGIGFHHRLEGIFARTVDLMNSCKKPIIALDCPSGLNCNTGRSEGCVVRASMTLSFGLAKPGFFVGDGPQCTGKLKVLPIGFPYEALRGIATSHFLFNERLAKRYLPRRKNTTHKSDYGHLLILAGQENMWGAGILASTSAYRMGAGYVTWSSFISPQTKIIDIPEVLTQPWQGTKTWTQTRANAIVIGPGLGVTTDTAEALKVIKAEFPGPVLVDADALSAAVHHNLFPFPSHWLITPHMGELSRILQQPARQLEQDRFAAATQATQKVGCHVLLKGFRSVLAFQNRLMIINSGNSALAKAGTGDVLAGMIGALLAQGLDVTQAAATGAYLHGRMADEWIRTGHDKRTLCAHDIKDHLPQLMARLTGGSFL